MSKVIWGLCALSLAIAPGMASAGWIVEWEHTPVRKGERLESSSATAYIDGNRTRLEQGHITTVSNYSKQKFSLLNPVNKSYWSGGIEDYVKQSAARRSAATKARRGSDAPDDAPELPEIDVESLPEISVEATDEKLKIAGYPTTKYVVRVNEELFQEVWVADDLDLSDDLDPKKVAKYQQKSSRGMIGNSSKPYHALYRSPEFVKLLTTGFALKTVTRHIAGSFEQAAKSVRESEVDASTFRVPKDYSRVKLQDVFTVANP